MAKESERQYRGRLRRDVGIIVGTLCLVGVAYTAIFMAGAHDDLSRSGAIAPPVGDMTFGGGDLDRLIEIGNQLMDGGQYEGAISHYDRALAIDSSLINVRVDRGSCLFALERYDEAISEFEFALSKEPDHAIAHFNMGITYGALGNDSLMIGYWEKYLELQPDGDLSDRIREFIREHRASEGG